MTDDELSRLWAFSRGDTPGADFERWFLAQEGLEGPLGEELHWELLAGDYADRDRVWSLRKSLGHVLDPLRQCECPTIRDVAAVPMGGDFYFEKVFETLDRILEYGPEKWWLHVSKCRQCATVWLIARDERIYDEFYLVRLGESALADAQSGKWPDHFQTYEAVLAIGRELTNPPRFLDPMARSLQWAVEDLLKERPAISAQEIAHLLGLSDANASALMRNVQA